MGGGNVVVIQSRADWEAKHKEAVSAKKIVVVDFTATWCGPCKMIAPFFESLSTKYPNALFLKVDVDDHNDIAGECGVRSMPTFHIFSSGKKVDQMSGANPNGLEELVKKHYKEAATFAGQGRTLGSSSSSAPPPSASTPTAPTGGRLSVDSSKPVTSIQIRMGDGSRLVGQFNTSHTVGDIRYFIHTSRPEIPPGFELVTSFPPKPLREDSQSIETAGLINAAISVK